MAIDAASPTSSTPPSGSAPTTGSTDRRTGAATPPATSTASSWPDEAYKGWASL